MVATNDDEFTPSITPGYSTEEIAVACGYIATALFTVLYMPQMRLNYSRKNTTGFSETSMIIKIVGGSFHFVNAYILGEGLPVILYGLFGLASYSILLGQIAYYSKRPSLYLWIILTPLLPMFLAYVAPETMSFSNSIKPAAQIFSHIALLATVIQIRSIGGISIMSQHLNLLGGLLGVYMLTVIPPKSTWTWFSYGNSLFQALTTYACAFLYPSSRLKNTSHGNQ